MQILLVSATRNEIDPTLQRLSPNGDEHIDVLISGIGSLMSAYHLTRRTQSRRPDFVVQAGIGGSFDSAYPPGTVVGISEEVLADLGALEQGSLTDIFDMGFAAENEAPFQHRMLGNPWTNRFRNMLPFVRAATVNGISASAAQVSAIVAKYNPVVESMEGAALHFVCLAENIPFLQLRAVSNFAGERNKANWKIAESIANLNKELQRIIELLQTTTEP